MSQLTQTVVVLEPRGLIIEPVSQLIHEKFTRVGMDWCTGLLSDRTLEPIPSFTRVPKENSQDALFAETFATERTIPLWQSFYRRRDDSASSASILSADLNTRTLAGEILTIVSFGKGVSGHANTAHGGFLMALLDEVVGLFVHYHQSPDVFVYTAYMNVKFKKPVFTPAIILCRVWMEEKSCGRKIWMRGTIEDGTGGVHAEADGLFIEMVKGKSRL